jgi:uncharacterized OB-fold protein
VNKLGPGIVYTETVVFSPPEAYVNAIIELESGGRITGRIDGERAQIGDRVTFADFRADVPFFRKQSA